LIVREFTSSGITAFKTFLAECRVHPQMPVPRGLLEDDSLAKRLSADLTVERRHFGPRKEAADYLTALLNPLPEDEVAQNAGLWTWLSLYYFDEVCPLRSGKRTVRNDYSYVFAPKHSRRFYRHLLFIAWYAARLAKPHDRLFMTAPVSSLDQVTDRVMSRLFLTRIPCIFEALDRLYWDGERGKARAGIVDQKLVKPGDLRHRLPIRVRQLERTYDLFSLTADQLVELLGEEFQQVNKASAKA
jgi:hypothetical protein